VLRENLGLLEVNYPIDTVFRGEALLREVEKELYHTSRNAEPDTGEASMNFTGCVHKSKSGIDFMLPARDESLFSKDLSPRCSFASSNAISNSSTRNELLPTRGGKTIFATIDGEFGVRKLIRNQSFAKRESVMKAMRFGMIRSRNRKCKVGKGSGIAIVLPRYGNDQQSRKPSQGLAFH
jgi:hypothetical protein